MGKDSVDVGELAESALILAEQGITKGTLTLKSGKVIILEPEHVLRLIQWAAQQRARKPKLLENPDDIVLKTTRHSDGGGKAQA